MDTSAGAKTENPAVTELRALLRKNKTNLSENFVNCDAVLLRYLRFNGQNVDKAAEMLQKFAEHNDLQGLDDISKLTFPKNLVQDFPFQLGGRDNDNRPVAMVPNSSTWSIKKYIELGQEETLSHFVMAMRHRIRELCLDRNVDSGVVIVNVDNFEYSQYFHRKSLMFLINLLQLLSTTSPGEISRVVVVNAPRMLKFLFDSLRKLVTINFDITIHDSNRKKWLADIAQNFPRDGVIKEFGGTLETYWEPEDVMG